jgi:hypothetical protein
VGRDGVDERARLRREGLEIADRRLRVRGDVVRASASDEAARDGAQRAAPAGPAEAVPGSGRVRVVVVYQRKRVKPGSISNGSRSTPYEHELSRRVVQSPRSPDLQLNHGLAASR